jgi:hypothetical protein
MSGMPPLQGLPTKQLITASLGRKRGFCD